MNYVRSDGHVYEKMLLKACKGCVSEVRAQLTIQEQLTAKRRLVAEQRHNERLRQLDEAKKKEEEHRKFLTKPSKERATVYGLNRPSGIGHGLNRLSPSDERRRTYVHGASFAQPIATQSTGMPGNEESDPFDYWFKRQSWT
ncbi:MAG: hypothetical protein GC190_15985 [Alphaproteobacteria bacterium]|nr:hypothetical protein [Alphaproteobacteria bacterium]